MESIYQNKKIKLSPNDRIHDLRDKLDRRSTFQAKRLPRKLELSVMHIKDDLLQLA